MLIRMPIDLKSLYLNIKNDNLTGHTPTVATPLRQGGSVHTELARILLIDETIPIASKEELTLHLLSKSRAEARIVKVFLFDSITVNGIHVNTTASYCIYIREETGNDNVHCGRQKVHYPQVLEYEDDDVTINNNAVIKAVSATLSNYAFIVQAFEYDTETRTLNFDALIVGENAIPYSKVFLLKRGVGGKFVSIFNEYADIYDTEIIALRSKLGYENISPENFMEIMSENKEKALALVENKLPKDKRGEFTCLSRQYPYSLYDIEIKDNAKKHYVIVRFTSTKVRYFNLPANVIRFINEFSSATTLALVTDINGSPDIHFYTAEEVSTMKKTISSVTFEQRG